MSANIWFYSTHNFFFLLILNEYSHIRMLCQPIFFSNDSRCRASFASHRKNSPMKQCNRRVLRARALRLVHQHKVIRIKRMRPWIWCSQMVNYIYFIDICAIAKSIMVSMQKMDRVVRRVWWYHKNFPVSFAYLFFFFYFYIQPVLSVSCQHAMKYH